ncbi:activating transcription factor 7-interacting protein 1 isoform X2 [Ooceraea biroi]|uniref:activating transcription factor 7-interacting protein 1 isoform X2 n=1 Tax=Ooceraea biroi TaxID=2015173 RepID=UPI000F0868FC|nr:activating transcription factor 7-interacting protein 1 isoform X2 [Ooceraea biroi]
MENTQAETACNSKDSPTISTLNRTDISELSKEKEDELLFGGEEEGDDEDALSDDSLRLRLSDDEDAEQEDITTSINISEFKSQDKTAEQSSADGDKKKEEEQRLKENLEEITKIDVEESVQKKCKAAIKAPENSALPSDEYTPETKLIENNIQNSEINNMTATESSEKCSSKSSKELNITEIVSANAEKDISSQNDNLCINILENDLCNTEQANCIENDIKEVNDDCKEANSTNNCIENKSDNVNSNNPVPDSIKDKICNSENLIIVTTDSNGNDDNLIEKVVNKTTANDHSVEHSSITKINNKQDSVDLVKPNNINDSSNLQDPIEHVKNKNGNQEDKHVPQNKDTSEAKSMQKETSTSLMQNQNSFNVKGIRELMSEDRDNNSVIEIIDDNTPSILQAMLLSTEKSDTKNNLNNENKIKNENQTSADTIVPRRRRSKRICVTQHYAEDIDEEVKQVTDGRESGRQKRRTARNAEEIIRKNLNLNSDSDFSDSTEELVTVNHKLNQDAHSSSLKRNCQDNEICNGSVKKMKMDINSKENRNNDIRKLAFIEKFFQRNIKEKLPKLTQEELEELLIQKIVETITMRSEIGQLREQARISERNQEITRVKLQQLMKQVKDFEMVLNRNAIDRRTNSDKLVAPIKINRSVGLQVNFIAEHGIQNLRQVQQTSYVKSTNVPTSASTSLPESSSSATSPRRGGIKVRSPRPVVTVSAPTISQSPMQTAPITVTPAALVVAKPLDSQHTLTITSQPTGVQPILPAPSQPTLQPIVINGKIPNQVNRQAATLMTPKSRKSDLIDLTDEEEKSKSNVTTTPVLEQQVNVTSKPAQTFQRVIQTIPTNVTIATQQTGIKVISSNQPAPTAIVNNINPSRLTYVMQGTVGSPRQVLITSNTNPQIRPVTSVTNRPPFPTVTYKTGISTIANGTVRVLTTPASSIQINKHPAPLPDTPNYAVTSGWKLPPPAPSLKISKVSNGIVLSWNMNLSDKYADIASYQLYAYQEMIGMNPSTSLWKKVGDVRALPLPMACTLTQFSEGNNYHFAVRAVDTHSRKGQYSIPGNISL